MRGYVMNRESLKRHCEEMCKRFGASDVPYTSGTYGEHRLVLELLEQTEWIPVSERLPEADELVLATWKRNGKGKAYVSKFRHEMDGCFFDYESTPYGTDEVLAWMPLPKPYKAGE